MPATAGSNSSSKTAAILLAGGSGSRMRGAVEDKILLPLAGKPALRHSADTFATCDEIDTLVLVHRDDRQKEAIASLLDRQPQVVLWAQGGAQRQDSVWAALSALSTETEIVLIHDAARPLVTIQAIRASIQAARETGAACLARPVTDTIKTVATQSTRFIPRTLARERLWAMETPQTFQYPLIKDAYRRVVESGQTITDDLSAIEEQSIPVAFVDNGRPNPKLTTPDDIAYLEFLLARPTSAR